MSPDFELGFYMELMKLGFQMGQTGMGMPNPQNQAQTPAMAANIAAGQGALRMPKAPMNSGNLMGTGGGGQQMADQAAGPSPMPGR